MKTNYIDGFVAAVPKANKQKYKEHIQRIIPVFREYGALRVVECWGDSVPEGKHTSFPMAVQCKKDEVVVFSWVEWASKEDRDKGMDAIMKDQRVLDEKMPFDAQRLIYGSFDLLIESGTEKE